MSDAKAFNATAAIKDHIARLEARARADAYTIQDLKADMDKAGRRAHKLESENADLAARVEALTLRLNVAEAMAMALERGIDLLAGDLVGADWKVAVIGWLSNARHALAAHRKEPT